MQSEVISEVQWFDIEADITDWRFGESLNLRSRLLLPRVYCPTCGRNWISKIAADIPEPLLPQVRELLKPYNRRMPEELKRKFLQIFDEDKEDDPESQEIFRQVDMFSCISPDEFFALEGILRGIYNLPPRRLIEPGASVGPILVRKSFHPKWDVYYDSVALYFSLPAGDELLSMGITGLELFPVYTRDGKPSEVYRAVVTGYAGLPSLVSPGGEYFQCPECKRWYLRGDHPLKVRLDESQWDGSDFFHLAWGRGVYVSERAYEILNSPFFSTEVWVSLKPMDGAWVHPDFDLAGNPFS